MILFESFKTIKGEIMRGGKREGAGRKVGEIKKNYRLPIELEPQIMELVKRHESKALNSVKKSKDPVKPRISMPNDEQLKRLQIWLYLHEFAKSQTEARKMTETSKKTRDTVLKYAEIAKEKYNWTIQDLINLYK